MRERPALDRCAPQRAPHPLTLEHVQREERCRHRGASRQRPRGRAVRRPPAVEDREPSRGRPGGRGPRSSSRCRSRRRPRSPRTRARSETCWSRPGRGGAQPPRAARRSLRRTRGPRAAEATSAPPSAAIGQMLLVRAWPTPASRPSVGPVREASATSRTPRNLAAVVRWVHGTTSAPARIPIAAPPSSGARRVGNSHSTAPARPTAWMMAATTSPPQQGRLRVLTVVGADDERPEGGAEDREDPREQRQEQERARAAQGLVGAVDDREREHHRGVLQGGSGVRAGGARRTSAATVPREVRDRRRVLRGVVVEAGVAGADVRADVRGLRERASRDLAEHRRERRPQRVRHEQEGDVRRDRERPARDRCRARRGRRAQRGRALPWSGVESAVASRLMAVPALVDALRAASTERRAALAVLVAPRVARYVAAWPRATAAVVPIANDTTTPDPQLETVDGVAYAGAKTVGEEQRATDERAEGGHGPGLAAHERVGGVAHQARDAGPCRAHRSAARAASARGTRPPRGRRTTRTGRRRAPSRGAPFTPGSAARAKAKAGRRGWPLLRVTHASGGAQPPPRSRSSGLARAGRRRRHPRSRGRPGGRSGFREAGAWATAVSSSTPRGHDRRIDVSGARPPPRSASHDAASSSSSASWSNATESAAMPLRVSSAVATLSASRHAAPVISRRVTVDHAAPGRSPSSPSARAAQLTGKPRSNVTSEGSTPPSAAAQASP
jgi:hypothetical protein